MVPWPGKAGSKGWLKSIVSHSKFEPCFNTASGGQELWQGKEVVRQRVLEDERDRSPC